MFGWCNKYLVREREIDQAITIKGNIHFITFSFKFPNGKGVNVRTAYEEFTFDKNKKVPSRFISGLDINDHSPFEVFSIDWDKPESGDPFSYDHRNFKGRWNVGNVPYCSRLEVMEVIRGELSEI